MKLINSSVKEIIQEPGMDGIYKQIAYGGHICYMSDKVGDEKEFFDRLVKLNHGSVLEHGTVYMKFPYLVKYGDLFKVNHILEKYKSNPYSKYTIDDSYIYVTSNMRVLVQNGWEVDLKYQCEPTQFHHKRRTFHVICPIGISREISRSRTLSPSESSTRYCNFSKDRFGKELTFIKPYWLPEIDESSDFTDIIKYNNFIDMCEKAEESYLKLVDFGCKPQEAREVLPLCTKTEVVYTAFEEDWSYFFSLRCDSKAHPDAQKVANMIKDLM